MSAALKLSTEKLSEGLATRLSQHSLPQKLKLLTKLVRVTMSKMMLEEKPNCMKMFKITFNKWRLMQQWQQLRLLDYTDREY